MNPSFNYDNKGYRIISLPHFIESKAPFKRRATAVPSWLDRSTAWFYMSNLIQLNECCSKTKRFPVVVRIDPKQNEIKCVHNFCIEFSCGGSSRTVETGITKFPFLFEYTIFFILITS